MNLRFSGQCCRIHIRILVRATCIPNMGMIKYENIVLNGSPAAVSKPMFASDVSVHCIFRSDSARVAH